MRPAPRLVQLLIVVGVLAGYEAAARAGVLDPLTFVPLSTMLAVAWTNVTSIHFLVETLEPTAIEVVASFLASTVIGIAGGVALWRSEYLHHTFQPYLLLFYAVPVFALYPVFIGIFHGGMLPVVVIAVLLATPAVIINTAIGLRETRPVLVKVGRSLRLGLLRMLIHIYFPSAWPHIFTGFKLAGSYSIIAVVATEFILSTHGLGHSISFAYDAFKLNDMYASIIILVAIALVVTGALTYVEAGLYRRSR